MGRNKIKIEKIANERNRQATFFKRKNGLFKKAMELSILCDCDVALLVFSPQDKLFRYASTDLGKVLERFHNYKDESTDMTNDDYFKQFAPNEDPNQQEDGSDSPPPTKKQKTTTGSLSRSVDNVGPSTRRKKPIHDYEDEEDEEFRQTKRESGRRTRSSKVAHDEEPTSVATQSTSTPVKNEPYAFASHYVSTASSAGPTPYSAFPNEEFSERSTSAGSSSSTTPKTPSYHQAYLSPFTAPPPTIHTSGSHPPPMSLSSNIGSDGSSNWHSTASSGTSENVAHENGTCLSLPPLPTFSIPTPTSNVAIQQQQSEPTVPIAQRPRARDFPNLTISIPPNNSSIPAIMSPITSPTSFCPKIPLSPNLGPSNPPLFSGYKSPRTPTTPSAPFSMELSNFRPSFLPHLEAAFNRPEDEGAGFPFINSAFSTPVPLGSSGGSGSGNPLSGSGGLTASLLLPNANGKQLQSRDSRDRKSVV